MQEQPKLVGLPAVTRGAGGFGVELVLLDQGFHFATRAIDLFIEMFAASGQIGDDIPDIRAAQRLRRGRVGRRKPPRGQVWG